MKKRLSTNTRTATNFKQTLANAANEVDKWPAWKKEALGQTILSASKSVTQKPDKSA